MLVSPSHLQACLEPEGQTMRLRGESWGWFGGNPSGSALKVKVLVAQSCLTLSATAWAVAASLLCPWNSPGKNTGVGRHSLLQGIFTGYRAEFCFFSHLLLAPAHTHVPFPSNSPRKELTDLWWWKIPNRGFMLGRWRVGILATLLFGPDLLAPSGPLPSGHNPSVCPLATGLLFGAFLFLFFFFFLGDTFSQQIFKHTIFIYLFIFNWLIALQYWFDFCHTSTWVNHKLLVN